MSAAARPEPTFTQFVTSLRQRFGEFALDVRHELFFLTAGRRPAFVGARAMAALLRDTWQLCRGPARAPALPARSFILLATLAGGNGWGTLARALGQLPTEAVAVLAHPRLKVQTFPAGLPLVRPVRPAGADAWGALRTFLVQLWRGRSLALASCLARRALWRASLARTLGGTEAVILLHNDFDLMSRAALDQGLLTVCLQHGLPTDEFFPTRADWQVVWGASSRRAFVGAGTPAAQVIEDALGRAAELRKPQAVPQGISLLSQTHAPVFGTALADWLRSFAAALLGLEPDLRVLLHPQEDRPYQGVVAPVCQLPPHAELSPTGCAPRLVLGCCTTALFDAALAGHWVVRLDAPLAGNEAALRVLDLPLQARSPEQVLSLQERLRDDPDFRHAMAQAQLQWLRESFTERSAGLADLLRRLASARGHEE